MLLLLLGCSTVPAHAADPAPAPKPELPRIAVVLPPGLAAGELAHLLIRGSFPTNATAVRLAIGSASTNISVKPPENAPAVDGFDAGRVGTNRIELDVTLPPDAPPGTNATLTVSTPSGDSAPFPLFIAPPRGLVTEKEPNNGFREAPETTSGLTIRGAIEAAGDVDVFQFEARAGDTVRVELLAERLGSTLDGSLTLYDATGNILVANDDTAGRDPRLAHKTATLGRYFVVVSSVNEKAAPTHVYLLTVTWGR